MASEGTPKTSKQTAPNPQLARIAALIGQAVSAIANASPMKRRTFCETGRSNAFARIPQRYQAIARIFAYESVCACRTTEPAWVSQLRMKLQLKGITGVFPHIRRSMGDAEWAKANAALTQYRRVKGFHRKWNAIKYLVDNSSLSLSGSANTLVVLPNPKAQKQMPAILKKLGSNAVKSAIKGTMVGMSEDKALRAKVDAVTTRVVAFVHHVGLLHSVWKDVENNRLAALDNKHPDVVAYKFDFYIAALEGSKFSAVRDHYREYDRLYRLVIDYVDMERVLDGRTVNQTHDSVGLVKPGVMRVRNGRAEPVYSELNRPYADAAL